MKKLAGLILLILVIIGGLYFFIWSDDETTTSVAVNKDTFVLADIGTVETLDPAKAYDTVSAARIWTVYQTLIFFDGPHLGKFVPVLSTEVPTVANGGISADGKTYTFPIRQGVKFHEGGELTAEDVVYSLKRAMICDPDDGPMWMLLEALTKHSTTRKGRRIIPGIMKQIDKSIEVKGNTVVIHLPKAYPPLMGILCYSAFSIIDKEWAIVNNAWDGNIKHAARYNKPLPGKEPLHKIANGTGPYRLKAWEPLKQSIFERFDGYWGPKPVLKTAIIKHVPEWNNRKLMLQAGDADRIYTKKSLMHEVKAMKNVSVSQVPQLAVTSAMFCQKINARSNPNIGSGKLDGNGIPPDFFSDINVRKAFLHAYDRNTFKKEILNDLGSMPPTPLANGMPYQSDVQYYEFNLEKAKMFMKKAWGGKVWEKGFKMVITYNANREERKAAAVMLANNIMVLNPAKFKIEIGNIKSKDYILNIRKFKYPIFIVGWGSSYPDPHNFMYPYMSSKGTYGKYMGYNNPEMDRLLAQGFQNIQPEKRQQAYTKLQNIWYNDALGIVLFQPEELWVYRDYVKGFVPNALFSQSVEFFYRISK